MESLCKVLLLFCLALSPVSHWAYEGPDSTYLPYPKKWASSLIEKGGISLGISRTIAERYLFHAKPGKLNLIEEMMQVWNDEILQWPDQNMAFFQLPAPIVDNLEYNSLRDYTWDHTMGIYINSKRIPGQKPTALATTRYRMARHNPGQYNEWLEITHADIILNGHHHKFRIYPAHFYTDGVKRYDLKTTVLHELGHLLGLPHIEKNMNAVMYKNFGARQNKWRLTKHDSTLLEKLYFTPTPFSPSLTLQKPLFDHQFVTGKIELDIDGNCRHYRDGQLVRHHYFKAE